MDPSTQQWRALIDGYIAGALDERQQDEFVEVLAAHPAARRLYIECMGINASLLWSFCDRHAALRATGDRRPSQVAGTVGAPLVSGESIDSARPISTSCTAAPRQGRVSAGSFALGLPIVPRSWVGFAALVAVVVAAVLFSVRVGKKSGADGQLGGDIVAMKFEAHSIRVDSGSTRVTLPKVGYAVIDGPAQFDLLEPLRARLAHGRVRVRVTEETGHGYIVETPDGEVMDLGTEFALDVESNRRSSLVVFEGAVDLRMPGAEQQSPMHVQRLVEGEAVLFGRRGVINRLGAIVTGQSGTFERTHIDSPAASEPLIVAVSDNLENTNKFYEIVPGGLSEDALAFVDRPQHQWNGETHKGIPPYLCGADYIKTFCDDKTCTDPNMEISVTLSRPSKVYIFFDRRLKPPRWLTKNFHNTGDRIGLDCGHWSSAKFRVNRDNQSVTTGPGNSIDDHFDVWERFVFEPGTIKLGPNMSKEQFTLISTMYGIAAIPLEAPKE